MLPRHFTQEEVGSVRFHFAALLGSDAFRGSERCKQFLTFVVERTLEGRQSEIKERILGTDLFGRPADYDLVGDSIVRVKANEARRRLGGFYSESSDAPVRIELAPGSYVPLIRWPNLEGPAALGAVPAEGRRWRWSGAALLAVGLVAAVFLIR